MSLGAHRILDRKPQRGVRVRSPRLIATLLVTAAALTALAASGGVARAAAPCAQAILADWQDNGRVDGLYDLSCYEPAIDAIPADLRDYVDAEDVITRAFHRASGRKLTITRKQHTGDSPAPRPVPPVATSSSPNAIPIPLLVLGGMSVTLLAAGGAGYVSRRRRQHELDHSEPPA